MSALVIARLGFFGLGFVSGVAALWLVLAYLHARSL